VCVVVLLSGRASRRVLLAPAVFAAWGRFGPTPSPAEPGTPDGFGRRSLSRRGPAGSIGEESSKRETTVESVNVSIIYYSSTGTVHSLAQATAVGAEKAGANVRVRKVAESAPAEAIAANPAWGKHLEETTDVEQVSHDDLTWADAVIFGTPTRFGNVSSQLKAFLDATGPLWFQGALADKVYSGFTSSTTAHGGQEATLLALANTFYHWGGIIVPPGYADPIQYKSGNPYGTSHVAGEGPPSEVALKAAEFQGRRVVTTAAALKAGRSA
jgi:NAD(P)H dehydrogenase (quinone)